MKKLFIIILTIFITGCSSLEVEVNNEYNKYIKQLKETTICASSNDYSVDIEFEKFTDKEYIYQVIVDNAKFELNNIRVLVIHDAITDDVFPSVGFFDGTYNLSNIKTDQTIKGINLVGYIPYENNNADTIEMKVLIIYGENNITNCYIKKLDRK